MKNIEIKHRWTSAVLFAAQITDDDAFPMRSALEQAITAGAYLANADLANADLANANLAGADLADADLANANLAGADLANADLANANLAGADLANADLANANLAGADLANADLANANLAGADLADADLANANLAGAYLAGANLADANLAGAYLAGAYLADVKNLDPAAPRTDPPEPYVRAKTPKERRARQVEYAKRYRERHPNVPVVENLDQRVLAAVTAEGQRLEMGSWHGGEPENGTACGMTHCRGGWAVMLAGAEGLKLERELGVERAAAAIYRANTGRVPHFYAGNERALEDIKRCAAEASQD